MKTRRGISLIELLVVLAMMAIIIGAAARSFSTTIGYRQRIDSSRDTNDARVAFEEKVRSLLKSAQLSSSATSTTSYFIGQSGNLSPDSALSSATRAAATGGSSLPGGNADTLVFTCRGDSSLSAALNSTDDWETLNKNLGPQGGVEEAQIGTTAVGDAGTKTGLFLREQRPADADPSQGGTERLINPDVATIQFEFWDGQQWQEAWDTRTQSGARRLPAAVRVTYTLNGEPQNTNHIFIVQIPNSDVTSTNPITQGTGAAQ